MAEEEKKERLLTVPLRYAHDQPRTKRADLSVTSVREFVGKHMKVPVEKVWIDPRFNARIWARGKKKPPTKVQVKAVKFWDAKNNEWYVEVANPED